MAAWAGGMGHDVAVGWLPGYRACGCTAHFCVWEMDVAQMALGCMGQVSRGWQWVWQRVWACMEMVRGMGGVVQMPELLQAMRNTLGMTEWDEWHQTFHLN